VVVGGQYGSEGKGKVALDLVRRDPAISIVVRPGGTNSGHTAYTKDGRRLVLRQLPAASVDCHASVILPAGSYIDVQLLQREMSEVGLPPSKLIIDPRAHLISHEHVEWERRAALTENIGSTGSGTGAAVISRLARMAPASPPAMLAAEVSDLLPYIRDTSPIMRAALAAGDRILIEGTQGFGLSPLHGDAWPKCTSRDTTAAAFVSEAGLSPFDIDEIVLVLRCHPIRVAGDSGPLKGETTWEQISAEAGTKIGAEFTSVTQRRRRIGVFDPVLVRHAICVNAPSRIVLNHLDYVDPSMRGSSEVTLRAREFINSVENGIGRAIDEIGTSETVLLSRAKTVFPCDAR
jgi:adenylosuccinate synthase